MEETSMVVVPPVANRTLLVAVLYAAGPVAALVVAVGLVIMAGTAGPVDNMVAVVLVVTPATAAARVPVVLAVGQLVAAATAQHMAAHPEEAQDHLVRVLQDQLGVAVVPGWADLVAKMV
jgi:hypothetical protein